MESLTHSLNVCLNKVFTQVDTLQRQLVLVFGKAELFVQLQEQLVSRFSNKVLFVLNGHEANQSQQFLGNESDVVLINTAASAQPSHWLKLAGTIRGGGLLILYIDNSNDSRFINYVIARAKELVSFNCLTLTDKGCSFQFLENDVAQKNIEQATDSIGCNWVYNIVSAIDTNQWRILGIFGERGRGKSTLLGQLTATLTDTLSKRILITSLSKKNCRTLFALVGDKTRASFHAYDELLENKPACDVLIIDEASSLPLKSLQALLQLYPHTVFASTTGGYEGSGSGLTHLLPDWCEFQRIPYQTLELTQPLRWGVDDVLESWLQSTFYPHHDFRPPSADMPDASYRVAVSASETLHGNRHQLSEVFGLLAQAHYQTSPNDLRQFLEEPGVLITIIHQNQIVACLWAMHEGPLDPELSEAIFLGKRRIQGQLTPQSLVFHEGYLAATTWRFLRISRIAVLPAARKRGLGRKLLNALEEVAIEQGIDILSTSFSVQNGTLGFWHKNHFTPVRLGFRHDTASASVSTLLIKPINPMLMDSRSELAGQLKYDLQSYGERLWPNLEPERKELLVCLQEIPTHTRSLDSAWVLNRINNYCCGNAPWLNRVSLLSDSLDGKLDLSIPDHRLLQECLNRPLELKTIAIKSGFSGVREIDKALRRISHSLLFS